MGVARSRISRKVQSSIQSTRQLEKVLDKEKPDIAPRHQTTAEKIDKFVEAHPEIDIEQKTKNDSYLGMLNKLHVDSQDPEIKVDTEGQGMMPKLLPKRIPTESLIELFEGRNLDPEVWTIEVIADKYKIDTDTARNLCNYYSAFHVRNVPPRKPALE